MRVTPRNRAIATVVTSVSAVALAATGAVAIVTSANAADTPDPADDVVAAAEFEPTAEQLVWSDEFDGPDGTAPSSANWTHELGDHGWGNGELQNYVDNRQNSALDGNGNLVITARQNGGGYTSARLVTKNKVQPQYGHIEARIQIPRGQGIWPAFWMLGGNFPDVQWPDSGEIDIMENVGYEPHLVHGTLHGPGYSGGGGVGGAYQHPQGWSFADDFHTFAIDWAPDRITWSVDGNAYMTKTPADVPGSWVYNQQFFMILNVAVGGEWPGYPDGTTQFPQRMLVDYVRVYDSTDGGGGGGNGQTGTVTTSNGMCLDVAGAGTADGTPVQLAWCNGNAAQSWTFAADGSVRALGKCLDVAGGATAPGTRVQLWTCNGTGAQQWTGSGGALRNPQSDLCLQPVGRAQNDGVRTEIAGCDGSNVQTWSLPS
ncbi:glycoside hydrolase family 16 protein [Myceligenerans cantabricum]